MTNRIVLKNVLIADPDSVPSPEQRLQNILVTDGRIAAIGDGLSDASARIIDGNGAIAVAGMVDAHRHIWQAGIRGVAADWSLADYIREIRMGYATAFTPDDVYIANLIGALEAIDTGVTTICDYCHIMNSPEHADAGLQGLRDAGIRGKFCYGFYDVPAQGRAFAAHADRVAHARSFAAGFGQAAGSLLEFGVALTEFGLVSSEQTDAEIAVARDNDGLITLHVGTMGAPHGIGMLDARGKLGSDMLHVHANLCHDTELAKLVQSGGHLVITPETEMQMGMGFPTTNRLIAQGGAPSFGVDIVSQNSGDMLTQIRLALQTSRAIDNQPHIDSGALPDKIAFTVRDGLKWATSYGADAMKYGNDIGRLTVGARADLALFATDGWHMMPMNDPIAMLLLQNRPSDARTVLIDGKVVKQDGQLKGHDMAGLRHRMNDSFRGIVERAKHSRDAAAATSGAYSKVVNTATGQRD